ncbi:MAG: hypothetical protein ACFFB0_01805 [Promethearchaeota archaeon]
MISKIFIITAEGELCYSKTFMSPHVVDNDIVNYLTTFNDYSRKLGGGKIRSLNFTNFKFIYSYDEQNFMYILISGGGDQELELRNRLELLKREFIRRYKLKSFSWDKKIKIIKELDEFTEKHIFIPPRILLIGEEGVGKTSILNLFPGETVLELDDDFNEILEKKVVLSNFEKLNEVIIREVNLQDIYENSALYKPLLDSFDIICIVTNSGAGNLGRTKNIYDHLKRRAIKADFYIIANFQDLTKSSFEPEKITESFGLITFGFSAIDKKAKEEIYEIINKMIQNSIIEKSGRFKAKYQ